jgi:6-phosphogluconolactonase (cycloisomerase 2 family)
VTRQLILVGSYTHDARNDDIGVRSFLLGDGQPFELVGTAKAASPSWITRHPTRPLAYAANEIEDGAITTIDVAPSGRLTVLDQTRTGGSKPCHLAVTRDGSHLVAAHYGDGSVAVFSLTRAGRIQRRTDLVQHSGSGPNAERQRGPHVHMNMIEDDFVTAVDLGTDELCTYRLSPSGTLRLSTTTRLPPGTGPRQIAAVGDRMLVLGELSASLLTVDRSSGKPVRIRSEIPTTRSKAANLPAQLTVSEDQRTAYISNRGPDTIAVIDLTSDVPTLMTETYVGPGWPRHFAVVEDTMLVAVQGGDVVKQLTISSRTCVSAPRDHTRVPAPACVSPSSSLDASTSGAEMPTRNHTRRGGRCDAN